MSEITLALYKPHRWYDIGGRLIAWWTNSPYSHCELLLPDGYSYSSSIRDGGVRQKKIQYDWSHWDFVPLPWANPELVRWMYEETAEEQYGWTDLLLRQLFNKGGNSAGYFCSEWCAEALDLTNPQTYSPGTLGDYCKSRI